MRVPADRQGALGEGRRRAEPGAGEPRAGAGRRRPPRPSGSSRSTRRSPTCSRCRPTSPDGWPRRWTWPCGRACAGAARPGRPTPNPRRLRRIPPGRALADGFGASIAPPGLRRLPSPEYEQAVALDSSFALALVASLSTEPDVHALQQQLRPCCVVGSREGARPPSAPSLSTREGGHGHRALGGTT